MARMLIGDLTAKVDSNRGGIEHVVGPHGSAQRTNYNCERLLLFCGINNMAVSNTFFAHRGIHKKTCRSPEGETSNEIDRVCISQRWKPSTRDVRACRGADVGPDHHLVRTLIRLKLKKLRKAKKVRRHGFHQVVNGKEDDQESPGEAPFGRNSRLEESTGTVLK